MPDDRHQIESVGRRDPVAYIVVELPNDQVTERPVNVPARAQMAFLPTPVAGTDAREVYWVPVRTATQEDALAFHHVHILRDAVELARSKLEYTTLATVFCTEPFTIGDLRRVYEVVWGMPLDPSNFRRKITGADGFLEPTGDRRVQATGRPASPDVQHGGTGHRTVRTGGSLLVPGLQAPSRRRARTPGIVAQMPQVSRLQPRGDAAVRERQ